MQFRSSVWLIVIVCHLLIIQGCGFRLRGSVDLPDIMSVTYIEGTAIYGELGRQLNSSFDRAGARLTSDRAEATAILAILKNELKRRVLTVDATTGQAREYELIYTLRFKVDNSSGGTFLPEQGIRQIRDYTFDPDNVLAKGDEEERLVKEMITIASNQMLRRISIALRPHGKVQKKSQQP